jgi:hypothetical protein
MSGLTEALRYAERGWHVIPLHTPEGAGCSCGKPRCASIGKHPRNKDGLASATTDPATIQAWWGRWPLANVGIRTGEVSGFAALDIDGEDGKASLQRLQAEHGTLPATLRALTGRADSDGKRKGCHYFFKMPEGLKLRNSAGVAGKGLDVRADGGYVVAAPSKHASGLSYQWLKKDAPLADIPEWLLALLVKPKPPLAAEKPASVALATEESIFAEGGRNASLTSLAGTLRNKGLAVEEMEAALQVANQKRCKPPLPKSDVRGIARSVGRYAPHQAIVVPAKPTRNWPEALSGDAYYGLAGEFVRLVGPQTEADPAALLFQCLVALGSIIGRGPHYRVGAERHHLNIFAVCVADSSKGRKGTSWNEVKAFCKRVDIEWWSMRIGGGLSTGEGLIHAVRDPIAEQVAIKEKGRVVDSQEQVTDPGVKDKRLLCVEGELGQALQCAGRDGNTLSPIIRLSWDGAMLRVMTRGAKGECAEPHISIIGHITNTELQTLLTTNDAANGFANRFLWVGVARSKCLPFGGDVSEPRLEELAGRTRKAVAVARDIGVVGWAADAADEWQRVYPELSAGGQGLFGSVTARAEAHSVRLASLYAVLDGSADICLVHLRAALELWRYAAESAAFIFGESLGDPLCDAILELLRGKPEGATRTEISEHFDRNKTKAQLDAALATLQSRGMIRSSQKATGGRAAEVWQLVSV